MRIKEKTMKKIIYALAVFLLCACRNYYVTESLERPVYLSGIEIRSEKTSAEDPAHALNPGFQPNRLEYTVEIPYDAERIYVSCVPETGASAVYQKEYSLALWEKALDFSITVQKEDRIKTPYTIHILRGNPEAQLAGLELYISDDPDPDDLNKYETDNYILNYAPGRGSFNITVPAYTDHIAVIARSYDQPEKQVSRIQYEFLDWQGNTIGGDGIALAPGYTIDGGLSPVNAFSNPALPSWHPEAGTGIAMGNIQIYPGDAGKYFAASNVPSGDPDPRGRGKVAAIRITVHAEGLDDKVYEILLQRDQASAYLDVLGIFKLQDDSTPDYSLTGSTISGIEAEGGDATPSPNRLIGSYSKTILNYEAALPTDALGVRVAPKPDPHILPLDSTDGITYTPYYYTNAGTRWYINTGNAHVPDPYLGDDPLANLPSDMALRKNPANPQQEDFAFDINDPAFQDYVRMEIYLTVKAASGPYVPKTYKVIVRRQKSRAELDNIGVFPYAPYADPALLYPGDGNVFTGFDSQSQETKTIHINAGRTVARVELTNTQGTTGRSFTIIAANAETPPFWDSVKNVWYLDVPMSGRNTSVRIKVKDTPQFLDTEYSLNLLSRGRNDIVVPLDAENDGQVRAVFASGADAGLPAGSVLPGELITLTVEANLGYYIDWDADSGGFVDGVRCIAGSLSMGPTGVKLVGTDAKNGWKKRTFRFYMPDENVQFEVKYRPTATAINAKAYVAAGARRGGGFGSGYDSKTGTSWGTASNDLQAVINSWTGSNFDQIWILGGTYAVPDPDTYDPRDYDGSALANDNSASPPLTNRCFPTGGTASKYFAVSDPGWHYDFSGITVKEDISFILRPGLKLYGGFVETDDSVAGRSFEDETVLSGIFDDGRQARHVVLALDAHMAELDGVTISGGMGPESDTSFSLSCAATAAPAGTPSTPQPTARTIHRQRGAGIYNINSSLFLTNTRIENNKTDMGAGMYTLADGLDISLTLNKVTFFNNTAQGSGGGMYNGTVATSSLTPTLESCFFNENKSKNMGGGIYNTGTKCTPTIRNTEFNSNSAKTGGGIYNAGGVSNFFNVVVYDNWTSSDGPGIHNSADTRIINLTVKNNVSRGSGNGAGIYNAGRLELTNANITANSGAPAGGGLCNVGTAILSNTHITANTAGSGGGVYNSGLILLANAVITGNDSSGNGGGIYNSRTENGNTAMIVANLTLEGNSAGRGGGMYNVYEGVPEVYSATREGSLNVILANARITGNTGGAVFNHYYRYSGRGINLSLDNVTIAGNTGIGGLSGSAGIVSWKDRAHNGADYGNSTYNESTPVLRTFPVTVRYRNTVVFDNADNSGSLWIIGGNSPIAADANNLVGSVADTTAALAAMDKDARKTHLDATAGLNASDNNSVAAVLDSGGGANGVHIWRRQVNRYWALTGETYEASLVQGLALPNQHGNLDGAATASAGFTGTNYRPASGSPLAGAANVNLYPRYTDGYRLEQQLYWNLADAANFSTLTSQAEVLFGFAIYANGTADGRSIYQFLTYDNSHNIGDLRFNGGSEGPLNKKRLNTLISPASPMAIGAYEP
jgi:hypothetical protein